MCTTLLTVRTSNKSLNVHCIVATQMHSPERKLLTRSEISLLTTRLNSTNSGKLSEICEGHE